MLISCHTWLVWGLIAFMFIVTVLLMVVKMELFGFVFVNQTVICGLLSALSLQPDCPARRPQEPIARGELNRLLVSRANGNADHLSYSVIVAGDRPNDAQSGKVLLARSEARALREGE